MFIEEDEQEYLFRSVGAKSLAPIALLTELRQCANRTL